MQAHIVQVRTQFEHLHDETNEARNNRLLLSIYFVSPRPLDELMVIPGYYQGQVEYEIDHDKDRCDEVGSRLCYILHVTAFSASGHSPGYNDAVKRLIGRELYDVLQPEWHSELLQLTPVLDHTAYEARQVIERDIRKRRSAYRASFADGAHILQLVLNVTNVTSA